MVDRDDVRGPAAALVHLIGMTGTIVGVPLVAARRVARGRGALVLPVAVALGATLTVATRRTAWGLVALWLGIDRSGRDPGRRGRASRPLRPPAGSPRRSSPRRGA